MRPGPGNLADFARRMGGVPPASMWRKWSTGGGGGGEGEAG